jgi:hypothetical protein
MGYRGIGVVFPEVEEVGVEAASAASAGEASPST